MGTSEQLASWRMVERIEQQAAHFEGLRTLRRAQARQPWLTRLAHLERWRDLESRRLFEASDKLTRVQRTLRNEREWRKAKETQRLPVSALLCSWRTLLLCCWCWIWPAAHSGQALLALQLPAAAMWLAVFLTRRR